MSTEEIAVTTEHLTNEEYSAEAPQTETPATFESSVAIEIPAAPETPPPLEAEAFDLEIDFETYTVPEDRALRIREEINALKSKAWLAQLSDWVATEGQLYQPFGEQVEMIDGSVIKRISWAEDHALSSCELIFDSLECEIRFGGKRFVSLQKLPKGDEVLISHYSPEHMSTFAALESAIHDSMKVYLKAKAEKTKAFQDRFKK